MDIDGHPPFATHAKQVSRNFGNLLFLTVFNFRGHFEGLNECFLGLRFSMIEKGYDSSPKMNLLYDTFPMSYHAPQMKIICQSYALGKLIHQSTQNGVHKTIGFSFSRFKVLDFIYDKRPLEPHFKMIFLQKRLSITFLLTDKLPSF